MTGIGYEHNKFVTCKDCPDRTVEPRCHDTCRGYLFRQERFEKIREARLRHSEYNDYKYKRVCETKERYTK